MGLGEQAGTEPGACASYRAFSSVSGAGLSRAARASDSAGAIWCFSTSPVIMR